jgi:hypothetical protein
MLVLLLSMTVLALLLLLKDTSVAAAHISSSLRAVHLWVLRALSAAASAHQRVYSLLHLHQQGQTTWAGTHL